MFNKRFLGALSRFMRPKTQLFAVKFRRILDVFSMQALWKSSWRNFTINASKNVTCLPWSSDAFWKISACKVYRKSYGWNLTIYASKNECVCCKVQAHFGSFLRAGFIKQFWVHFHVFASKNGAVCREIQTHFGSSPPPRFTEIVLYEFSRFMRPKTKVFVLKFTHILEVICLQGL